MVYKNIQKGIFRTRLNRFISEVDIAGKIELCHVKNTGRCKELLVPGATVFCDFVENPKRSTQYDLVVVEKRGVLVNIDSYAPNRCFGEFLKRSGYLTGITKIKAEAKYGNSRFDFYVESETSRAFIEVKGVTLEENGVAKFPDAPTERGIKHLNELAACISEGYDAYAIFIVQMEGVSHFTPNYETHAAFGEKLAEAMEKGVKVSAFDCHVQPREMSVGKEILIKM